MALSMLSAATLAYEITLTRLFSVAQFYHFAFLIVSIALLGNGASGTFLAIANSRKSSIRVPDLAWLSLMSGWAILGSYLLTNFLPFDSFSIALDPRQGLILIAHFLGLAAPFFSNGLAVGGLLSSHPGLTPKIYSANLLGSAAGCLIALISPNWLGGEGTVLAASGLASLAVLFAVHLHRHKILFFCLAIPMILGWLVDAGLRLSGGSSFPFMELHISPYKGFSYALQYPGAEVLSTQWNATSRIDLVRSPGVRSLPGLSYTFRETPPAQDGILVDADDLSPVLRMGENEAFAKFLPSAIAFILRPSARVLALEPRGGLDISASLAIGAKSVTAVEANTLIMEAAKNVYSDPRVTYINTSDRSYIQRSRETFDVIIFSLTSNFHPVRSGAYSLTEDYRYTIESFQNAYERLAVDGILVITRWLQTPLSEELRLYATLIETLEREHGDPLHQIVAYRGYSTITFLLKRSPFTALELLTVRQFLQERAFDLVVAPDIRAEETNVFNVLPESTYYVEFLKLLNAKPRSEYYKAYLFDISPPTDDWPFFNHYFKWSQAGQVWQEFGKTWQPFGGAGYFVILALLALATFLSGILVILPAFLTSRSNTHQFLEGQKTYTSRSNSTASFLAYFGLIGLAYMLVEIPLIQKSILFLDHPAYAISLVLFCLLFFSGLGSRLSRWVPHHLALGCLTFLAVLNPIVLDFIYDHALRFSLEWRLLINILTLAPLGLLMGIAFPAGLARLTVESPETQIIPWIWAVNGFASVIASILAALLALSLGFNRVLLIGAMCYAIAWAILMGLEHLPLARRLAQLKAQKPRPPG